MDTEISQKYTEIFKLKEMLENSDIPFEFANRSFSLWDIESYQIGFPELPLSGVCVCSVIESDFSYGRHSVTLEIAGLLTDEEKERGTVIGHLSADDVFTRIKNYYQKEF